MNKTLFTLWGIFALFGATAQTYWEGRLDTVAASGYYNVELSQQAIGLARSGSLDNIRILDTRGAEVPCLVQPSSPVYEQSRLQLYSLVTNSARDSMNLLVVDNASRQTLDRFYITMRGAEVDKWVSLRGSDDGQSWYIVKQRTPLHTNRTSLEVGEIYFPQGNYRYYEITITNAQHSPLEITGVGRIESSNIYGQFVKINHNGTVISEDSADKSTVVSFPAIHSPFRIAKVEVAIGSKTFYRRDAAIFNGDRPVESLELSVKSDNTFFLDQLRVDSATTIRIANENNPPLAIDRVTMYGLGRYLCAYLEQGKVYTLKVGGAPHGDYDIAYFKDELTADLPVIGVATLQMLPDTPSPVRELRFFEQPIFLWGMMILAGAVLLLVCIRALREMKKREG